MLCHGRVQPAVQPLPTGDFLKSDAYTTLVAGTVKSTMNGVRCISIG